VRGVVSTVQKTLQFLNHAASKAAICSFARTWAAEPAGRGIRVNTIVPAPTNTLGLSSGLAPDVQQAIASGIPLGRLTEPDEIANAVLFLASPQSSFMTGSEILIDGGVEQV
jgi:NAD(P)-dependent dehydrogenase (short-subunit alcohol dehydrogenase family)